jgi:beta-glucosidase
VSAFLISVALAAVFLFTPAGASPLPPSLASVHPELWPAGAPPLRQAAVEKFVAQTLAQMTLEEKIGQMIQADIASISPADLRTYKLGSILAGGGAAPGDNVRTTPQAWLDLTDAFYRASLAVTDAAHPAIPILFGIDAVHGHAKIVGATIFPHNVGLGAAHDPELIRRIGQATAEEVASTGIDWTFAPTVAVVRDVRWGRSYESYSESPVLVSEYAAAMVSGIQGERDTPQFLSPGHTLSSVKHFLGDGGTLAGRDQGDTEVSEAQLSAVHGAAYPSAIKAGALIVMASYNSWNGVKLHGDHYLLTDILKGRLAFDGFVVGDWNAHEQVPGCTKYRCAAAFLAGVDMLMAPDGWKEVFNNTLAQVKSGEIPLARVDDAVQRILRVKVLAGLFQRAAPKQRSDAGDFARLASASHRALAREAVRKSLVLLKNDHGILPLNAHSRVLVAGEAADSIGTQAGGWTIDWQGNRNTNADFPQATSIYGGIKAVVSAAGGSASFSRDGQYAEKPDAAIVVFGEGPYAEYQGDRETLEYSPRDTHDLDLLKRLRAAGVPTVAIFISGRPMWVNPQINASDAFVAAWLPGSEGQGIAEVLFRSANARGYDFTGRLSFSWPATAMPVTFDAAGAVSGALFSRGYGLDYEHSSLAPRLSEQSGVPATWRSPPGSLYHAAHVTAPWSIFVADETAEVHATTAEQTSPSGSVDVAAVAAGSRVTWKGMGVGLFSISGRPSDLRPRAATTRLVMRYRVERAPDGEVRLGMRCSQPLCGTQNGALLDVTDTFKHVRPATWNTLSVPLSCFTSVGADLSQVEVPFVVETSGHFSATFSDITLSEKNTGREVRCPR